MRYRADIDGLRTLAILLVLVFHFDLFSVGKAGFIGVDIFFVISGFLITAIIRRDLQSGEFRFGEFLYRRVRRLYPALIATLALTLLAGWVLFLPYRLEELAIETILSLLYVVNFHFWQNINYFGLQANDVPLLHMWSLAVEEQFYFLFPLFCMVVWRFAPKLLLALVCLVALGSFGLGLIFSAQKPEAAFYLLPTRAWELMIGSILALVVHTRTPKGAWLSLCGPVGLVLVACSVLFYGPVTQIPGWFALLPTLGATALILGGYATGSFVTRFFASAPMVFVGKISYPLYLVHWPIRIFIQEHVLEFTIEWRVFGVALSFLTAAAIYYLIETPLRHGIVLKAKRAYVLTVVGATLVGVGVSGFILLRDGVPNRFVPEVAEILDYRTDLPTPFFGCGLKGNSASDLCSIGDENADLSVLVIGDSHAQALAGAADIWLRDSGRKGALAVKLGCMPVLGFGDAACRRHNAKIIELASKDRQIQTVVFISIWRQGLPEGGKLINGVWVSEPDVTQLFTEQLTKTTQTLTASNKEVLLIEPLFAADGSVPKTLAENVAFGRNRSVDRPLQEYVETFAPILTAFDVVEAQGVQRVSVIAPFCETGMCSGVVDLRPLFTDNNHLAFSQSGIIAKALSASGQ